MVTSIIHKDDKIIITVSLEDDLIEIEVKDKCVCFIDGYASICLEIEGMCAISGIIDSNYNIVLPFAVAEDKLRSISVFKNKKAIYENVNENGKQTFSLIDLANPKYININGKVKPIFDPLIKMDDYEELNDEKALAQINNKYVVLDVSNNKLSNIEFDRVIENYDKNNCLQRLGVIKIPYKLESKDDDTYYISPNYSLDIIVYCPLTDDCEIENNVVVAGDTYFWLDDEMISSTDSIREAVVETFHDLDKKEQKICKRLI